MVGQLSGKAGSTVASRNRSGSYFKTKTIPKLVVNLYTEAVKNNLTTLSKHWGTLTDEQQLSWGSWAAGVNRTDSLGLGYTLTGSQGYMLVNRNLHTVAQPAIDLPPSSGAPDNVDELFSSAQPQITRTPTTVTTGASSATQTVGSTANMHVGDVLYFVTTNSSRTVASITDGTTVVVSLTISTTTGEDVTITTPATMPITFPTDPPEGAAYGVLMATGPLSLGINRPGKSQFRIIHVGLISTFSDTVDEISNWQYKFGVLPANTKAFLSFATISAEGLKSGIITTWISTQT